MRERHQDIHIIDGEEARLAVDHTLVPVVIDLIGQGDDIPLFEAQLTFILWFKVVERSTTWLVHRGCEWTEAKHSESVSLSMRHFWLFGLFWFILMTLLHTGPILFYLRISCCALNGANLLDINIMV